MNQVDEVLRKEGEELRAIRGTEVGPESIPLSKQDPSGDDPEAEDPS